MIHECRVCHYGEDYADEIIDLTDPDTLEESDDTIVMSWEGQCEYCGKDWEYTVYAKIHTKEFNNGGF